ncbi:MAG: hypothetical protein DRI36_01455 [Caldiserica bacterium]|nr:MAG: hypothetical protein DRI36_01455 [Caldisericota bacterium]
MPEKKPVTQQQKIMLAILGVIGLFVFYKRAFAPLGKKAKQYKEEIRKKEQRLAHIRAKIARFDELMREYEELKKEVEIAEKKLPRKKEIPKLLKNITDIGRKYGIDIDNFRPAGSSTKQSYTEHYFAISIKSTYHKIASFFAEIGQQERIMSIKDLILNPKNPTPEDPTDMQANFTLVVYTFKGK